MTNAASNLRLAGQIGGTSCVLLVSNLNEEVSPRSIFMLSRSRLRLRSRSRRRADAMYAQQSERRIAFDSSVFLDLDARSSPSSASSRFPPASPPAHAPTLFTDLSARVALLKCFYSTWSKADHGRQLCDPQSFICSKNGNAP